MTVLSEPPACSRLQQLMLIVAVRPPAYYVTSTRESNRGRAEKKAVRRKYRTGTRQLFRWRLCKLNSQAW